MGNSRQGQIVRFLKHVVYQAQYFIDSHKNFNRISWYTRTTGGLHNLLSSVKKNAVQSQVNVATGDDIGKTVSFRHLVLVNPFNIMLMPVLTQEDGKKSKLTVQRPKLLPTLLKFLWLPKIFDLMIGVMHGFCDWLMLQGNKYAPHNKWQGENRGRWACLYKFAMRTISGFLRLIPSGAYKIMQPILHPWDFFIKPIVDSVNIYRDEDIGTKGKTLVLTLGLQLLKLTVIALAIAAAAGVPALWSFFAAAPLLSPIFNGVLAIAPAIATSFGLSLTVAAGFVAAAIFGGIVSFVIDNVVDVIRSGFSGEVPMNLKPKKYLKVIVSNPLLGEDALPVIRKTNQQENRRRADAQQKNAPGNQDLTVPLLSQEQGQLGHDVDPSGSPNPAQNEVYWQDVRQDVKSALENSESHAAVRPGQRDYDPVVLARRNSDDEAQEERLRNDSLVGPLFSFEDESLRAQLLASADAEVAKNTAAQQSNKAEVLPPRAVEDQEAYRSHLRRTDSLVGEDVLRPIHRPDGDPVNSKKSQGQTHDGRSYEITSDDFGNRILSFTHEHRQPQNGQNDLRSMWARAAKAAKETPAPWARAQLVSGNRPQQVPAVEEYATSKKSL